MPRTVDNGCHGWGQPQLEKRHQRPIESSIIETCEVQDEGGAMRRDDLAIIHPLARVFSYETFVVRLCNWNAVVYSYRR